MLRGERDSPAAISFVACWNEGQEVHVLDYQKGLFHDELESKGAKIRIGSVVDQDIVDEVMQGCEVVHHVAAAFRELNVSNKHYWKVNVDGTRNVADAAMRLNVRKLVYCSTQGVHGHIKPTPGNESSPVAPEDYYQYSKYEGEIVIKEFVEKGLDAVILRPTAIYGPGDAARFLMLFKMVKKGRFLMAGNGKTYYHPVHITNLVDAFELAADSDTSVTGEAYIIGDENYWTLNELVRHVANSMDCDVRVNHIPFWPLYASACVCEVICKPIRVAPPLFRRRVNWFRQDRAFTIDKARNQLGYQPRIGIEEGLRETANWYREHNYI